MRVCYDHIKQPASRRHLTNVTIIIGSYVTFEIFLFCDIFSLLGHLELIQIIVEPELSLSATGSAPQ